MKAILCGSAFFDAIYATGNCGELVKTPGCDHVHNTVSRLRAN
jgi:hypothetical protein